MHIGIDSNLALSFLCYAFKIGNKIGAIARVLIEFLTPFLQINCQHEKIAIQQQFRQGFIISAKATFLRHQDGNTCWLASRSQQRDVVKTLRRNENSAARRPETKLREKWSVAERPTLTRTSASIAKR